MSKSTITIIIYFLTLTIYGVTEIILKRKTSDLTSVRHEKSFLLFVIPFYICVYFSPLEYVLLKPRLYIANIIIGFSLFYAGIILRIIGLQTLGNNFSTAITSKSDGKLVVNGIYKFVRHPLYLAALLISVSGSIVFSCLIMWAFVILTIIGMLIRINKEESFLIKQYKEYIDYKKNTKKLFPFIY